MLPVGWKSLVSLLDTDEEKLQALNKGLSLNPDRTTEGILLINKALLLSRRDQTPKAVKILGKLALDAE